MRDKRGFTLIELLVVIVIILILAAILFPVFVSAREKARTARCASNLKNIGIALSLYHDDFNGIYPGEWEMGGPSGGSDRRYWMFCIIPYLEQTLRKDTMAGGPNAGGNDVDNIFKCPSAPWIRGDWRTSFGNYTTGHAYSMNETGWTDEVAHPGLDMYNGLHARWVKRPADWIYIAEGMGFYEFGIAYGNGGIVDNYRGLTNTVGGHPAFFGGGCGWASVQPPDNNDNIPLYTPGVYNPRNGGSQSKIYNIRVSHDNGAICLFFDGHVKLMKVTKCYNWGLINYTTP